MSRRLNKLVASHQKQACVPFGAITLFRQKRIIKIENWVKNRGRISVKLKINF
jgi:hypothetical protein